MIQQRNNHHKFWELNLTTLNESVLGEGSIFDHYESSNAYHIWCVARFGTKSRNAPHLCQSILKFFYRDEKNLSEEFNFNSFIKTKFLPFDISFWLSHQAHPISTLFRRRRWRKIRNQKSEQVLKGMCKLFEKEGGKWIYWCSCYIALRFSREF